MTKQNDTEQQENTIPDREYFAMRAILDEIDRYRAIMSAEQRQTESTDNERKRDLRPRQHRRAS